MKLSAVLVGHIKESEDNQSKNASDPAWVGEHEAAIIQEPGGGQSEALLRGCSWLQQSCHGQAAVRRSTAALLRLGGSC